MSSHPEEYVKFQGQREKYYVKFCHKHRRAGCWHPVVRCSKLLIFSGVQGMILGAYWRINALDFTISLMGFVCLVLNHVPF